MQADVFVTQENQMEEEDESDSEGEDSGHDETINEHLYSPTAEIMIQYEYKSLK